MNFSSLALALAIGGSRQSALEDIRKADAVVVMSHPDGEQLELAQKAFGERVTVLWEEGYRFAPIRGESVSQVKAYWAYHPDSFGFGYLEGMSRLLDRLRGAKAEEGGLAMRLSDLSESEIRGLEVAGYQPVGSYREDSRFKVRWCMRVYVETEGGHRYRINVDANGPSDSGLPLREEPIERSRKVADVSREIDRLRNHATVVQFCAGKDVAPVAKKELVTRAVESFEDVRMKHLVAFGTTHDLLLSELEAQTFGSSELLKAVGERPGAMSNSAAGALFTGRGSAQELRNLSDEDAFRAIKGLKVTKVQPYLRLDLRSPHSGQSGVSYPLENVGF